MFLIAIPRLLAVVALSSVLSCAPSESLDRSKSQKETEEGDLNFGKFGTATTSTTTTSNRTNSSNTGVSAKNARIDAAIDSVKPAGPNIDLSRLKGAAADPSIAAQNAVEAQLQAKLGSNVTVSPVPQNINTMGHKYYLAYGADALKLIPPGLSNPTLDALIVKGDIKIGVTPAGDVATFGGSSRTGASLEGKLYHTIYLVQSGGTSVSYDRIHSASKPPMGGFVALPGVNLTEEYQRIGPENMAIKYAISKEFKNEMNAITTATVAPKPNEGMLLLLSYNASMNLREGPATGAANDLSGEGGTQIELGSRGIMIPGNSDQIANQVVLDTPRPADAPITWGTTTKVGLPLDYDSLEQKLIPINNAVRDATPQSPSVQ